MKIEICNKTYDIEAKVDNLLSILTYIKTTKNPALSFRSGCKSGVCGSCAVVVNGIEKLACKTTISEDDKITPLKNLPVIRDLVVDVSSQNDILIGAKSQLQKLGTTNTTSEDEKKIDKESNCILCHSCYSACPVYSVNKDFIAPFALVRSYRYIEDAKETNPKTIIDAIIENGIFSCTLCGNCNMVCPSSIDIKGNIMKLQNKSVQFGHTNPNMNFNTFGGFDGCNFL